MEILNVKRNAKNYKTNSIYNRDFKWPKPIKKTGMNLGPACTLYKCQVNESAVAKQEYAKKVKDFQTLFDRFPNLKDVLCTMNTDEMNNFMKEKNKTVYDSDYNQLKEHSFNTIVAKAADDDDGDDDDDLGGRPFKRDERIRLKKPHVKGSAVKYSGISPPEPYVVPISEYRSTIHSLGMRIIKEQLMVPKTQ